MASAAAVISSLLVGVAAILAAWLAWTLVLLGIGRLALRVSLGSGEDPRHGGIGTVWYGLAVSILLLQLCHLVFPVTGWTTALLSVIGVGGLSLHRRAWPSLAAILGWSRANRWPLLLCAALVSGLAVMAMRACCAYDTALYQLPTVQWLHAHSIVPGLGNLYAPLAHNSSGLLFAAAVDTGPLRGFGTYVAFGIVTVLFAASAIWSLDRLVRAGVRDSADAFRGVLLTPVLFMTVAPGISSYGTDLVASILIFAAVAELYSAWSALEGERHREGMLRLHIAAVTLAASATMKLNVLVLVPILLGGIVVFFLLWPPPRMPRPGRRWLFATVALTTALGASWGVRGVVQTGYPAFPVTVAGAPVDWQVPEVAAEATRLWIRYHSRTSEPDPEFTYDRFFAWDGWQLPKLKEIFLATGIRARENSTVWRGTLPLALILFLLPVGLRGPWKREPLWVLLPAVAAGAAVWFAGAPAGRFGAFLWWLLAAGCCARALRLREPGPRARRLVGGALLVMGLSPLWVPISGSLVRGDSLRESLDFILNVPPESGVFWPVYQPSASVFVTDHGLELWIPGSFRCATIPLPCTPYPLPGLKPREPGDLGAGFVVEGAWNPDSWPQPGRGELGRRWIDSLTRADVVH